MVAYSVHCEFDVTRRIGWNDTDDLARHIDTVVETLRQGEAARRVEVNANLETGRVILDMDLESSEMNRVSHARAVLAVAIRSSGGRHSGVLPDLEKTGRGAEPPSWSALRGATWLARTIDVVSDLQN